MGQVWAVNSLGGYMYSDNLSKKLREEVKPTVKFRQFCDAKDATALVSKGKGAVFHWNVYSKAASQGGTLVETNTMPETQFTITQGTLTITEYGNSVPYTGKLDDLSEHPVTQVIKNVLKEDAKKAFDIGAHAQFNAALLRVVPTGGTSTTAITLTTNGTATLTNSVAFQKEHVGLIIDTMKERNIPPYIGDDYYALAWPSAFRTLKNDLESVSQYTTEGFQKIMNGELGKYDNVRFVEQTHIPKGGAADSTTWNASTGTADAWNNSLSDWIFFFGNDTVAEGIAIPEEIRGKIPTDYGRSKGIAWYSLLGYGIVHSDATNSRIVKWDSAA